MRPFEESYLAGVAAVVSDADREQFVAYARQLLTRDLPVLFSAEHLAFTCGVSIVELANISNRPGSHYSPFRIAKRRGGSRRIDAPSRTLKHVQRWVQKQITSKMPMSDSAHGFRSGRSIASNAAPHVRQSHVLKYDLEDFFGTVSRERVHSCFRQLGYSLTVSTMLTDVCVLHGALPQGAPTSPDLANASACNLDHELALLASDMGLSYTRYADDLTFSGAAVRAPSTRRSIEYIIRRCGFRPNDAKRQMLTRSTRQRVTGVVVNDKVNWPRDLRRWLRQELHFLERYGVEGHLAHRHNRGVDYAGYRAFIYGHVLALNSVRPDEGTKLLARLDALTWPA